MSWRRPVRHPITIAGVTIALAGAACSSGLPTSVVPTHPAGPRTVYVAIGASDSLGFGTEDPARQAWPHLFFDAALPAGATLVNLGVPGATVNDAIGEELPYVASLRPTVVTVFLGVNDLRAGVTAPAYGTALRALLSGLRATASTVLVANIPPLDHLPAYLACRPNPPPGGPPCSVVGSLPPLKELDVQVAAYDREVAAVAAASGATVVDLYAAALVARTDGTEASTVSPDGFHPSPAGHRLIASAFAHAYRRATVAPSR